MGPAELRCLDTMRRQHGLISFDQAVAQGLSPRAIQRRVTSGSWARHLPRVYGATAAPATWEQALMAAVLWGGAGAAVSHRAAARLWELPGFSCRVVEVTIANRRKAPRGVVVHHLALAPADITRKGGLRVTTPARTLVDLSGKCRPDDFDVALHHCVRAGLASPTELRSLSERFAGRGAAGAPMLRKTLAAYGDSQTAPQSPLETRVLRLLRRSGLPPPVRQHEVRTREGRRRYLDFAWPSIKLAVEADGYRWHSSRSAWAQDRKRLRELADLGWDVVSVTHDDLARPGEFLRVLRRAHGRRSSA